MCKGEEQREEEGRLVGINIRKKEKKEKGNKGKTIRGCKNKGRAAAMTQTKRRRRRKRG